MPQKLGSRHTVQAGSRPKLRARTRRLWPDQLTVPLPRQVAAQSLGPQSCELPPIDLPCLVLCHELNTLP